MTNRIHGGHMLVALLLISAVSTFSYFTVQHDLRAASTLSGPPAITEPEFKHIVEPIAPTKAEVVPDGVTDKPLKQQVHELHSLVQLRQMYEEVQRIDKELDDGREARAKWLKKQSANKSKWTEEDMAKYLQAADREVTLSDNRQIYVRIYNELAKDMTPEMLEAGPVVLPSELPGTDVNVEGIK